MQSLATWGLLDASIILGIWWLTGRLPLWAVAVGVPCYALGSVMGPRLLASVFPSTLLGIACSLGGLLAFGGMMLLMHDHLSVSTINTFIWFLGAMSPSGWVILMIRDVIGGHLYLWAVIPLLVVSAAVTRSIAHTQELQLLNLVGRPAFLARQDFEDEKPDAAEDHPPEGNTLSKELAALRRRGLLDYPWEAPLDPRIFQRAAWCSITVLAAAAFTRFGILFPDQFRYVVFACTLAGACILWMPLLGVPSWFNFAFLSTNRVASAFVLFPVPFRRLLRAQILRDIRDAARGALLLFALSTATFIVAFPVAPLVAAGCGLGLTLFFLLKLPLRWFHLALWPLSSQPFGIGNIMRGSLIAGMAVIFLMETVAAIVFAHLILTTQLEGFSAIFCFMLGLLNGGLGAFGVYVALSAYEKRKVDVIKYPPRS